MNRGILFLATFLLLAANGALPCRAQAAVQAILTTDITGPIYVNEIVRIKLTVDPKGLRLHENMSLGPLSKSDTLERLSNFDRKHSANNQVRQFECLIRVTAPGTVTIQPSLRIHIMERRRSMIGFNWVSRAAAANVTPLTVKVLAVPQARRPDNYSGAVGSFSFDVTVDPTEVAVGELVTARSAIKGTGHLDHINPPRFSPGHNFKVYNPKLAAGSSPSHMIIEQVLIPQRTNAVAVPPVSFCFFDPRQAKFISITRGPFPLTYRAARSVILDPFRPDQTNAVVASDPSPRPAVAVPARQRSWRESMANLFRTVPRATVRQDATAYLAPSLSALETFDVPTQATVDVLELSDDWARISLDQKRGWMPLRLLALTPRPEL